MENLSSRTESSLLGPSLKRLKEGLQDSASRTLVYSYEHDGRCRPARTYNSNRIEIISRCKLEIRCIAAAVGKVVEIHSLNAKIVLLELSRK